MTNAKETNGRERRETAADGIGASASPALTEIAPIVRGAKGTTEIAAATIGGKKIVSATARGRSDRENQRISHTERRSAHGDRAPPW